MSEYKSKTKLLTSLLLSLQFNCLTFQEINLNCIKNCSGCFSPLPCSPTFELNIKGHQTFEFLGTFDFGLPAYYISFHSLCYYPPEAVVLELPPRVPGSLPPKLFRNFTLFSWTQSEVSFSFPCMVSSAEVQRGSVSSTSQFSIGSAKFWTTILVYSLL